MEAHLVATRAIVDQLCPLPSQVEPVQQSNIAYDLRVDGISKKAQLLLDLTNDHCKGSSSC